MTTATVEKKPIKKAVKKEKYNNLLNASGIFKNDKLILAEIRKQAWK